MGLIPILRKGTRTKLEMQNIRLKAEITDYLWFSHLRILRLPRYSLTFGFPWTRPSVHSPLYQWNNCSSNITRILSTILNRKYFDSTRFVYMRFSLSPLALLEISLICKLAMQWFLMRMYSSWLCPFKVRTKYQKLSSKARWYKGSKKHC